MCKMNLASKMLVLLSANMSLATYCATIKGEMAYKTTLKKGFHFLLQYITEHWFYFIIKQLENQDNAVKSFHLGLFLSLQRCEVRG